MSKAIKYYLIAYNGIAFLAWLAFGVSVITGKGNVFLLLGIAQSLALLEIVHAVTGWVRSPVGSTAAQVASRILVVVLFFAFNADEHLRWTIIGFYVVSFAWTITELVRYSFYFLGLLESQPRWLLWMRYSFFILLYPIGVSGEWMIILSPLIAYGFTAITYIECFGPRPLPNLYYGVFVAFLAVSYIYYFPVLYRYMWKQRKAKL
jgi:very-long-chain (3R)-3-hydroxyacyl-CoA dehydratase